MEQDLLDAILTPFNWTQEHYDKMLASPEKPLGENTQTKIRAYLHNVFSPLSSWVADNAILSIEQNLSIDEILSKSEKATAHFLSQSDGYIKDIKQKLTQTLSQKMPEKIKRIDSTILSSLNSILTRGKEATKDLCQAQEKENTKIENTIKVSYFLKK